MKTIILQRLSLTNFKGVRNLTIDFSANETTIKGDNGTGKSTLFDAFTWLLFGKDSKDRKQFDIKTLDKSGKIIPKLPHEVSGTLIVNGEQINLTRRFNEKWTKRRGTATEEFSGNEEERLYNDVPCSVREWNDKIANICSEEVFKIITSPSYFVSQSADFQRTMLFRMVGGVSDAEIAGDNSDFKALLDALTGKTMEEYKREIQAKKRRIKNEIESIPERIDERKRDIVEDIDFGAIESQIKSKQVELNAIEEQLKDVVALMTAQDRERNEKVKILAEWQNTANEYKLGLQSKALAEYNKSKEELNVLDLKIKYSQCDLDNIKATDIAKVSRNNIEKLVAEKEELRAEWKRINAEKISFTDNDFICPTCHRQLDVADIEEKRKTMVENFNKAKTTRLERNVAMGKDINSRIEGLKSNIAIYESAVEKAEKELEEVKLARSNAKEIDKPDIDTLIENDDQYSRLKAQIEELSKDIYTPKDLPTTAEIVARKTAVISEIDALKSTLSQREVIERNNERIAELESQLKSQSEEVARLEGIEITMRDFAKAKINTIENKVNRLFEVTKFKMFDTQVNGAEVETCEATYNGVPYSSLNSAMKINVGLDIINAICKYEDIEAPIFVDNAESVVNLFYTRSQLIRLVVTTDAKLIIE